MIDNIGLKPRIVLLLCFSYKITNVFVVISVDWFGFISKAVQKTLTKRGKVNEFFTPKTVNSSTPFDYLA